MLVQKTSLEEIGWKPYWDASGRHPVMPGDSFDVKPNGVLEICYMNTPIQDENGKWYTEDAYLYDPFPGLIAGMYNKERLYTACIVGGDGSPINSISGKIEEIAMWGKSIGEAGMVNYQQNLTGMIGSGIGDKYLDIQAAKDDMLYQYYKFDTLNPTLKNYDDGEGVSIKNGDFVIGTGKYSNAVSFADNDSFIGIEKARMESDFSMNIRFYIEELKDFVLFSNKNFIEVTFDEVIGKFKITTYPYIGDAKIFYSEIVNMKVHHWYDFGIDYDAGQMSIFVDGVKIDSESINIGIGGVEKITLDMSNVASITVDNLHNGATTTFAGNYNPGISYDSDPSSKNLVNSTRNNTIIFTITTGAKNAMNLIHDRVNNQSAFVNRGQASHTVVDAIADFRRLSTSYNDQINIEYYVRQYNVITSTFEEKENDIFTLSYRSSEYHYRPSVYSIYSSSPTIFKNKLLGNQVIRLRITFKDELTSNKQSFPMLTTFPGTRMKIVRRELVPDEVEWVKWLKDNNRWGRYWKNASNTSSSYLTTYPAFYNTSGKTLIIRIENSSKYAYVWNGYVAYITGEDTINVTSYDANYRHVYPDSNWPAPEMSIKIRQD